jgi:amidase
MEGFTRRVASWWTEGFDLLVTPTLGEPPPPLGYLAEDPDDPARSLQRLFSLMAFTPQFNATGQPAISLPLHWSSDGLPIGVQVVAAYAREDLLLGVAGQLERSVPWSERRPPIRA